jgi:predicted permease
MNGLLADCRHAMHLYRRTPGASAIAVVVLAVGMAAVTTFVSLYVDQVLRPHPGLEDSGRLVTFGANQSAGSAVSADFVDRVADESTTLESAAGIYPLVFGVARNDAQVVAELVTDEFFDGIRPRLALGRGFQPAEYEPEGDKVVVVSYRYWQQNLGGREDVIGTTLAVRSLTRYGTLAPLAPNVDPWVDHRIVGVMAPTYRGHFRSRTDAGTTIWLPFEQGIGLMLRGSPDLAADRAELRSEAVGMQGVGLRAAGASPEAVQRELAERFVGDLPFLEGDPGNRITVLDGIVPSESMQRSTKRQLRILLGSSVLLALVAAANVSLFLLARAPSRRRELGIRMAVGARSNRMARQLATEAGLLVVAAAALGMACSVWLTNFIRGLPMLGEADWRDVRLFDWRVLAIVGAFLALLTLLVSLAPIVGLRRSGIAASSRQHSARAGVAQRIAGTVQIAIAGMLGGAAVAFAWYLGVLVFGYPGFETRDLHVLRYSIDAQPYFLPDRPNFESYYVDQSRRREAIASLPGVTGVSLSSTVPGLTTGYYTAYFSSPIDPTSQISSRMVVIDDNYVNLLGLKLVYGRAPDATEPAGVLVNQSLARQLWGHEDVVGEPFPAFGTTGTVVGVLEDLSFRHPMDQPNAIAFANATQQILNRGVALVQSELSQAELREQLTELVDSGALEVTIDEVTRLGSLRKLMIAEDRARGLLVIAAGALVVLMAAFGYYGTQRYLVTAGRREYAIRASLGATPARLGRLVAWRGLTMSVPGLIVGGLLAYITVAWVRDEYLAEFVPAFQVTIVVLLGMCAVLLAANFGPAREARRTQPAPLLREE